MTASTTAIEDGNRAGRRPTWLFVFAASAITGAAAGVLLAAPTISALEVVWTRFLFPAYDELIRNGLLAWCM